MPDAVQSTDVPNVTVVVYDGAGSPTYFVTAVCMERDTDTSECVTEDQRALAGTATQAVIRLKRPDGRPATGILFSDLTCYKSVDGAAAAAVTLATITTLGTYASNGLKLISDANMPGEYAWHPETLASAGKRVRYMFTGTKIRPHVWSCDLISGADGRQAPLVVADIGKDSADRTIDAIASMAENVDGTIMTYYRPSTGLPISLPITRAARTYPVTSLR